MRLFPFFSLLAAPVLTVTLGGCTVGPNYAGPPAAAPRATTASTFQRAGDAAANSPVPTGHWWEELGDPVLNDLVTRTLAHNPNVQMALARLKQARAGLRLERANSAPNITAAAVYAHAHVPGVDLGSSDDNSGNNTTDLNLYNLGFDASWEIDLFGGQRRAVQAARASAQTAQANMADTQVSLSAEVAQAYINLRDRQQRIALRSQSLAMQMQMLDLTRQRADRGTASSADIAILEQAVETTRAQALPLEADRDAYLDELAVLVGEEPGALDTALAIPAPLPMPPAMVAIGDPAALLQRRPDIRAAERTLAADTAKIGKAEAARFPRLSFMGLIGIGGTSLSALSHLDDFAAIAAPQLSWSFLDFGRNRARVTQAEGVRDEAEAQYRATVLGALRDAEGALSRFSNRRVVVATLARAKASADQATSLAEQRYAAGTITLTDLLDKKRQGIAAQESLIAAQAGLTGDFVSIQKALGLGWDQEDARNIPAR
jgi:NodT family efflux transporter outer membrane factor (OMF) lipoprotein